jgi:rhomboid family GlyGly-CTERM serine protease
MNMPTPLAAVGRRLPNATLTLVVGLAAVAIGCSPSLGALLQFDRAEIFAGEIWRLATCYLTHWNADHLRWDLLMFVGLGAVCEMRSPWRMRVCVATAAATVSGLVYLVFPDVQAYRGLSGIDTALFTLLAIDLMREAWNRQNYVLGLTALGLFVGLGLKTAFEAATGHTYFVDVQTAGFVPLVWDHVAAGVVGIVFSLRTASGGIVRGLVKPEVEFAEREFKATRRYPGQRLAPDDVANLQVETAPRYFSVRCIEPCIHKLNEPVSWISECCRGKQQST